MKTKFVVLLFALFSLNIFAQEKENMEYQLVSSDYESMPPLVMEEPRFSASKEVFHHTLEND